MHEKNELPFRDAPESINCIWTNLKEFCNPNSTELECFCSERYTGVECRECSPGYHSFPDCEECICSQPGTILGVDGEPLPCDPTAGQCACKPEYTGIACDECSDGFYKERYYVFIILLLFRLSFLKIKGNSQLFGKIVLVQIYSTLFLNFSLSRKSKMASIITKAIHFFI